MITKPLTYAEAGKLFGTIAMYYRGIDVVPIHAAAQHLGQDAVEMAAQEPRTDYGKATAKVDGHYTTVGYLTRQGYYKAVQIANVELAAAAERRTAPEKRTRRRKENDK